MDWITISMFSSFIPTSMTSRTWLDSLLNSGYRVCLLKLELLGAMKTKSRIESELHGLSAYLVRLGFEGGENFKPRLSVIVKRSLVWVE